MWKLTLGSDILNMGTQIPGSIYLWSWKRQLFVFQNRKQASADFNP
jgi:hypothetical protein